MHDKSNSIANALELLQFYSKPSICPFYTCRTGSTCPDTLFTLPYGVLHVLLLRPYNPSDDDDNEGEEDILADYIRKYLNQKLNIINARGVYAAFVPSIYSVL